MNTLAHIRSSLLAYIEKNLAVPQELLTHVDITLNVDAQKQQFGDMSTNVALMLSKELHTNPRALAQRIIDNFSHEAIEKYEIAGPGFINIFLRPTVFCQIAQELYTQHQDFFKLDTSTQPKKYSLEFVSANPTGPLHLGHGRGGIIGDVLGNILSFLGHSVTKEFYINDAGSQIQKLGLCLKIRIQQALGIPAELPEDGYKGEYLITLAQECIAQHGNAVLTNTDSFFANYAKEHLLAQLQETLKNYGIIFDVWFSEKSLHTSGAIEHALEILNRNGHIYEKDNAVWFKSTDFGDDKDRVLKKNTGELTYVAADVAYLENKLDRGFDHLIMILGQDHHSYVVRLKAVLQGLGKNPHLLDIILYQLVTLKESGQILRMSKRAGRSVDLEDVINTVGKDVARFFYLNKKADAHLEFDIDLALKQTDENPVYYIQYAYVRIRSILEKSAQESLLQDITAADSAFITASEAILLKKIASLATLLITISKNYQTHALTYYVIELAQAFHSYYGSHRVIDMQHVNQSRGRLFVISLVRDTLKTCFDLLGISAPERM